MEAGFHGRGDSAAAREDLFGRLESDWRRLRAELSGRFRLSSTDRQAMAIFMALQYIRTREHITSIEFATTFGRYLRDQGIEIRDEEASLQQAKVAMRRYLADVHLGFVPREGEVEAAWTVAVNTILGDAEPDRDRALAMGAQSAVERLAPLLETRTWRVIRADQPILWTGDRCVMPYRPPGPEDSYRGLGLSNAQEIRFPLGPTILLVMSGSNGGFASPTVRGPAFFAEVNADVAAQCYEFVIAVPGRSRRLNSLDMASKRPAVRFNQAPGVQRNPDGSEYPMGDVIQQYVPLRVSAPSDTDGL